MLLKYLSNFWRTLGISLINFEFSLILTWSKNCGISSLTAETFVITDTKLYVSVVTSSTENNIKLLKELESGFKRAISRNKYQSNPQIQNRYFPYLIDPSFQVVNRPLVFPFETRTDRTVHTRYYIPKVDIKVYNVIIDGKNFFDQAV